MSTADASEPGDSVVGLGAVVLVDRLRLGLAAASGASVAPASLGPASLDAFVAFDFRVVLPAALVLRGRRAGFSSTASAAGASAPAVVDGFRDRPFGAAGVASASASASAAGTAGFRLRLRRAGFVSAT